MGDGLRADRCWRYATNTPGKPLGPWRPHGVKTWMPRFPDVFGTLGKFAGFTPSARELALSSAMNAYWARFAANGDPNGAGATFWPRYDPALDSYLDLDNAIFSSAGVRPTRCDFWDLLLTAP